MSREQCNHYAREILSHFTFQNQIRYSLGEFTGNWDNLQNSVENWWREYKAWEAQDTLADAYMNLVGIAILASARQRSSDAASTAPSIPGRVGG